MTDVLLALSGGVLGYVFGVLRTLSERRNERRDVALAEIFKEMELFHRYLGSWTYDLPLGPHEPTSDNGWHEGEHRILREKWRPYEEDIHMPLLVRGPGVAAGSTSRKLVINTDYFPTFTDLAGIQTPSYADGRSLRRVLEGDAGTWRRSILLEAARNTVYRPRSPAYHAVRTSTRKYVRYGVGARELYDLTHDPYEQRDSYRSASPPADLASRLRALEDCARRGCRAAENRR